MKRPKKAKRKVAKKRPAKKRANLATTAAALRTLLSKEVGDHD